MIQIRTIIAAGLLIGSLSSIAQDKPTSVRGTFDINYRTRTETDADGKLKAGVQDEYRVDLVVAESAKFSGTIHHLPTMFSAILGREVQSSRLDYNVALDALLGSQSKRVGKLVGSVPINREGRYEFGRGDLRIGVDAIGRAQAFESRFSGIASGKPPKNTSKLASVKKDAITLTRQVGGKSVSVVVKDYDRMAFQNLVLGAGPVQIYGETTVNGEMLYDYERSAWYFRNVTLTYSAGGKETTDRISGNIRWSEDAQRATNGQGEYQFDVRVNEPEKKADETAVFAKADDESAFFETDPGLAGLTGAAKYKDQFSGNGTDTVVSSKVTIDLAGSHVTKQQTIALSKLLFLVEVVPMNAD